MHHLLSGGTCHFEESRIVPRRPAVVLLDLADRVAYRSGKDCLRSEPDVPEMFREQATFCVRLHAPTDPGVVAEAMPDLVA
jgi:hypothetical protein